jgi:IclR family acetate operon transcriptional repressor
MAVKTIQVVSNALVVLEGVSRHQPAGLGVLARDLGLDKSAVQRILATLHTDGWIQPDPDGSGGWTLTARALTVGGRFVADSGVRERARGVLRELHAATGETVWLTVADGDRLVVADEITSTHVLRVTFPVGHSGPFGPETAGGLALLATTPPGERQRIGGAVVGGANEEALAETRRRGYAIQAVRDVPLWAAATALPVGRGAPPMAVVIGVPLHRCTEERLHEFGEMLVRTVRITFRDA